MRKKMTGWGISVLNWTILSWCGAVRLSCQFIKVNNAIYMRNHVSRWGAELMLALTNQTWMSRRKLPLKSESPNDNSMSRSFKSGFLNMRSSNIRLCYMYVNKESRGCGVSCNWFDRAILYWIVIESNPEDSEDAHLWKIKFSQRKEEQLRH